MSNRFGPDTCAADSIRCEALVKGSKSYQPWMAFDRRCTKKAIALRDGFSVCGAHNRTKSVKKWTGGKDNFKPRRIFHDGQSG